MAPTIENIERDYLIPSGDAPAGLTRMLPSQIEVWVKDRLSRFAVLSGIDTRIHFTGALSAILLRLDHEIKLELLSSSSRLKEIPSMHNIVTKHISKEFLDDLDAALELAEADSRVEVVKTADKDGDVYVEGEKMVYTDHSAEKVDLENKTEGWASW